MKNFRLIPRLEVKSGKLIKGMRMEGLRVMGDPVEVAYKYYKEGADEIIYDDIVASLYSRPFDLNLIKEISKNIHIPFTVGGGIRHIEDIHQILNAGADKVCINTNAVLNPRFIYDSARKFGSQCIVIEIQGKNIFEDNWEPFTESGRNRMFIDMFEWIKKVQEIGAGELFFISIDDDGMNNGINKNITRKIKSMCDIPVIIGGGTKTISDLQFLVNENVDGCVMSKILHSVSTTLPALKRNLNYFKEIIRR